jgi:tetratricopeptide (TPR) repeat protein
MLRRCYLWSLLVLALSLTVAACAQQEDQPLPPKNPPPPRSDSSTAAPEPALQENPDASEAKPARPPRTSSAASPNVPSNESSSRSNIMDISPPIGDVQEHPDSEVPQELVGTTEMHPWNPHKAEKNVEIGDYYFKEKNYRAAESRYREALYYKENDATATLHLAEVLDKMGRSNEARESYQAYLKIMPHGPNSIDAHKALERLDARLKKDSSQPER